MPWHRTAGGVDVWITLETLGGLHELADLAEQRRRLDQAIAAQVRTCREHGASWGMIGSELGVTRQAARQRYRDPQLTDHLDR